MNQTAPKVADIRYRVQLKNKPHIVIYQVMSHFGNEMYDVTLIHGKVNNCTCPAKKPCYHWRDVQAREDARVALEHRIDQDTVQHVEDDLRREYAPLNGNKGFSLLR